VHALQEKAGDECFACGDFNKKEAILAGRFEVQSRLCGRNPNRIKYKYLIVF
jgi:hypothetical protein